MENKMSNNYMVNYENNRQYFLDLFITVHLFSIKFSLNYNLQRVDLNKGAKKISRGNNKMGSMSNCLRTGSANKTTTKI